MKRFIQTLGLAIVLAIAVLLLGARLVQALRDAAGPPPLPYGLTQRESIPFVEPQQPGMSVKFLHLPALGLIA